MEEFIGNMKQLMVQHTFIGTCRKASGRKDQFRVEAEIPFRQCYPRGFLLWARRHLRVAVGKVKVVRNHDTGDFVTFVLDAADINAEAFPKDRFPKI